jgi:hypothetical protein
VDLGQLGAEGGLEPARAAEGDEAGGADCEAGAEALGQVGGGGQGEEVGDEHVGVARRQHRLRPLARTAAARINGAERSIQVALIAEEARCEQRPHGHGRPSCAAGNICELRVCDEDNIGASGFLEGKPAR